MHSMFKLPYGLRDAFSPSRNHFTRNENRNSSLHSLILYVTTFATINFRIILSPLILVKFPSIYMLVKVGSGYYILDFWQQLPFTKMQLFALCYCSRTFNYFHISARIKLSLDF